MAQLPLFLNSAKLRCLMIGGGTVAARKLETLVKHGVSCRIVAKSINEEVQQLADENELSIELRSFAPFDLDGVNLVIAATNDRDVNAQIAAACASRSVMVNVVDDYELSTATFPAIVDRSPVLVAVSTDGRSPTLARRIKSKLEGHLSEGLGRLAEYISAKRKEHGGEVSRPLWDAVIDSTIPDLLERGDEKGAEDQFKRLQSDSLRQKRGLVSLVGAQVQAIQRF